MLKEISQFILDHAATAQGFSKGHNFFVGHLPLRDVHGADVPVRCMVILERAGGDVNGQLPDYVAKAVQVWNRNDNYFEARADAQAIYDVLHGFTGHALHVASPDTYYAMVVDAVSVPMPLDTPNEREEFEFSTNYIFRIEGEPPTP